MHLTNKQKKEEAAEENDGVGQVTKENPFKTAHIQFTQICVFFSLLLFMYMVGFMTVKRLMYLSTEEMLFRIRICICSIVKKRGE